MKHILWFFKNLKQLPVIGATKILTRALRKDRYFRFTYQSAIAVAFQDEIASLSGYKTVGKVNWHIISNNAANRFLDMWIKK